MNIMGMVREKMGQYKKDRKLHIQVATELKTRKLEEKARFDKALTDRLKRQQEAEKISLERRQLQREIRGKKTEPIRRTLGNLRKKLKANQNKIKSQNKPSPFSMGSSNSSPFGGGSGFVPGLTEPKAEPRKYRTKKVIIYE